jgi:hypothetical protein
VRRVEGVVLGRGTAPAGAAAAQPSSELDDRLWTQVMGAIGPQLKEIGARARAARDDADTTPMAAALARDAEWLIGELHAAWAREVALRAQRASGE